MDDSVSKSLESKDEAVILGRRFPQSTPETPEEQGQLGIKRDEPVGREEAETTKAGGISGNVPEAAHPVSTDDVEGESSDCQETLAEWRMMTGDTYQEFLANIVQQFVQDAGQCIEAVQTAVSSGDAQAMREAAHGLKGISGIVGAKRLEQFAMELENACNQPSCDTLILSLDHIQFEFEKVRQIFTRELTHVSMNS
jgi:HPt (histidine-containing phosphotransfer) domain-containing protein